MVIDQICRPQILVVGPILADPGCGWLLPFRGDISGQHILAELGGRSDREALITDGDIFMHGSLVWCM
jgi:hypothetical protein